MRGAAGRGKGARQGQLVVGAGANCTQRPTLGAVSSSILPMNGTSGNMDAACWKNANCLKVGIPRPNLVKLEYLVGLR